jgi:hypothetical protein
LDPIRKCASARPMLLEALSVARGLTVFLKIWGYFQAYKIYNQPISKKSLKILKKKEVSVLEKKVSAPIPIP